VDPISHFWWDITHDICNALKMSANNMWDFIYANPYLKYWYEELTRFTSWGQLEPGFWKDYFIDGWYIPATGEAARRYYSAYQCEHLGVLHVASGIQPTYWSALGKFFDFSDQKLVSNFLPMVPRNFVPRPDNKHILAFSLKETLERFVPTKFPIKTTESEPRFLLVTLDVETGDVVTFDSKTIYLSHGNSTKMKSVKAQLSHKLLLLFLDRGDITMWMRILRLMSSPIKKLSL
jgi:hypothetical protein